MYLLRSIDVWSCAKVTALLYGCLGLLVIPMMLIAITANATSTQGFGASGATALILLSLFAPVIYGLLGFLSGAVAAWLYNVIAKYAGGISIELQISSKLSLEKEISSR
jgi:hypothetical protein